jgi:HipA-like kinase
MIPRLKAVAFLKAMGSGRTRPCLMLCEDEKSNQHEIVVKLRAGMELREVGLICELMASLLASDLGMPIPDPAIISIEDDIVVAIPSPEIANLVGQSVGLNFGTKKLHPGLHTWLKDRPIPVRLRSLAVEVFAFDLIAQNPDRRRENPNIQWRGGELYIYDHDLAFSFVVPLIGWQPPWIDAGQFFTEHIFYRGLVGAEFSLDRLVAAFEAISNERFREYLDAVPGEWKKSNESSESIIRYLTEARENVADIVSVIRRLLR